MKNNINKKVGATLLAAAIMAGTAVIPMSNAAVEAAAKEANKPSIQYRTQVQDYGWEQHWSGKEWRTDGETAGTVGQGKRMEAVNIRLINCEGVSLDVVAHVQDYGDIEYKNITESTMIGTQKEEKRIEAIKITANGLKEKGYKIVYRTQVQDYGWEQHWSGKEWREEGEWSGTRGESKRLETIEIKVVPINESAVVAKYVDTLESYDIVMAQKLNEDTDEYKLMYSKIVAAIANMRKAETNVEATNIYNSIVEEIKAIEPKVEAQAPVIVAEAQTTRDEAMEKIREYQETLSAIVGIEPGAVANLNVRISAAIVDINKAKSSRKIGEVIDALDNIIDGYELEFTKTDAINAINAYSTSSATKGVKDLVAEEIEKIKKVEIGGEDIDGWTIANSQAAVTDVETRKNNALAKVRDLIAAQELSNNKFDVYARKASDYQEPLRGYITGAIAKYRADANAIKDAKNVPAEFNKFVSYLKLQQGITDIDSLVAADINNVNNANTIKVDKNVAKEILDKYATDVEAADISGTVTVGTVTLCDQLADWNKKASWTVQDYDVSSISGKTEEASKRAQKLAKEYIKEYVNKIEGATTTTAIDEIMNGKAVNGVKETAVEKLNAKIKTEMEREDEYKNANKLLNEYTALVPTLGLTNLSDVEAYIKNTRSDIEKAETKVEIQLAENRFLDYMTELKIVAEKVKDEQNKTKADAIRILQKYTRTGNLSKVIEIAEKAIEDINSGAIASAEANYVTGMNKILAEIKLDAYIQLNPYTDVTYGNKTDAINKPVAYIAKKAIDDITSVAEGTNIDTCENAIISVNRYLSNALREISTKAPLIEDQKKADFNKKREELEKELQDYIDTARFIYAEDALPLAENAKYLVSGLVYTRESKISDLTDPVTNFKNTLGALTDARSKALVEIMYAKEVSNDLYTQGKNRLNAIISEVTNTIRNISDTSSTATKDITNASSKVEALRDAYKTLYNSQKTVINRLESKFSGASLSDQEKIRTAQEKIKKVTLDETKLTASSSGVYSYDTTTLNDIIKEQVTDIEPTIPTPVSE